MQTLLLSAYFTSLEPTDALSIILYVLWYGINIKLCQTLNARCVRLVLNIILDVQSQYRIENLP